MSKQHCGLACTRSKQPSQNRHLKTKGPLFMDSSPSLLDAPGESHRRGLGRTEPCTPGASTSAGGLQASVTSGARKQTGDEAWGLRGGALWGPAASPRAGAHFGASGSGSRASQTLPSALGASDAAAAPSRLAKIPGARGCDNLTQGHNTKSGVALTSCPTPGQAPRVAEAGRAPRGRFPSRGACARGSCCVGKASCLNVPTSSSQLG